MYSNVVVTDLLIKRHAQFSVQNQEIIGVIVPVLSKKHQNVSGRILSFEMGFSIENMSNGTNTNF